jgi:peptide/nickel transport system substrate-binding protein
MEDPANKNLIVEGGQLHTAYITMNTRMKPFDDLRVRKAINMAINKDRLVKILNSRAVPANQVLPPLMPGYDKDYKGYAYDPDKAKALLAEAGLTAGFKTELYAMNVDPNPRLAQAMQQDLAAIGITADLKTLAQATVIAAGGQEGQAPMIWSGGMAAIADFPDPASLYFALLSCGAAVPGGWNWSWYCNPALDKDASAANAMADPTMTDERIEIWRKVFIGTMDDAAVAPMFHDKQFTMISARLAAGKNKAVYVDPLHIPVNYDTLTIGDVP